MLGYTMLLSGVLKYYQLEDFLGNDIIRLDNQANQGRFNISIYGKICKIWTSWLKLHIITVINRKITVINCATTNSYLNGTTLDN